MLSARGINENVRKIFCLAHGRAVLGQRRLTIRVGGEEQSSDT
jgi:hypothetical protein